MHRDQRGVLRIPLRLGTLRVLALDDLHTIRVGHREIIRPNPDDFAISLVHRIQFMVAVHLGNTEDKVEFREASAIWSRELVQWIEEESVYDQAEIETCKVEDCE